MTDIFWLKTIAEIQHYTLLTCCLISFFFFSKLSQPLKILSYYLFGLLVIGYVATDLSKAPAINNLHLLHLLVIVEFIFLSLFYKRILRFNHSRIDLIFKIYLILIGGFTLINSIWIEGLRVFNTNGKILVQFIIIILSVVFFYQRSMTIFKTNIYEKSLRLVNSALLIYYSGSFIYFLIYKFTSDNKKYDGIQVDLLIFNASLYLLFTILILIAILMVITQRKKPETP